MFYMPASIPISANEKKWFLKLIHEVYDIHIVDAYSCQRLSDELVSRARISISYNTLRRLFGIIKGSQQASRFTLDSLSKSLGYSDFDNFQVAVNQFEVDYFNQLLILNRLKKRKDDEIILRIVHDFQFASWDEVYQLKSIVDLCLEVENYSLLANIFQLESFNLRSDEVIWKLYVSFQSIFIQCKLGNLQVIDFIAQLMPTNEMAQRTLLQLYVDEDELDGYYGQWLALVSIDLVEDMEMFRNLMLMHQAVQHQQFPVAMKYLDRCNQIYSEQNKYLHPILLGRLAAWNLMLKNDQMLSFSIFKDLSNVKDHLFFLVFFYRLQVIFDRDITVVDLMEKFKFDDLSISFSFYEKENLNVYYLLKARYFLQKKRLAEKAKALSKFNPLYKYSCLNDWVDQQLLILN